MDSKNDEIIIKGEKICFSYRDKMIFDNLDFAFKKGEHIGIIGESGCGKTTFLKIISGILTPDSGTLTVNKATKNEDIRKNISVVMQDSMIMPLTVRENITLGHDISKERLNEIIEVTKLDKWISSLKDGVDTYLGSRADELSGGQAQRIAIARALAKQTDILYLDEPTSALDKATADEVMEDLSALIKDKTVVHITHRTDLLKGYKRILRMEEGKLYE